MITRTLDRARTSLAPDDCFTVRVCERESERGRERERERGQFGKLANLRMIRLPRELSVLVKSCFIF